MVTATNDEMKSNEPTSGSETVAANVPREVPASPDENTASPADVEDFVMDPEAEEARRPAGEAGLFGDPRPHYAFHDDQDGEPELVRS